MIKHLAVLLLLFFITACSSTPNLSGWAEQTSNLRTAIARENSAVVQRIDKVIADSKLAQKEEWDMEGGTGPDELVRKWNENKSAFIESAGNMNATWQVISQYADAVASLAASGEKGREASQSILDSTKSILGIVAPGLGFAVSPFVSNLFGEIGGIITRMQAQETLHETLEILDPEIEKLTDLSIGIATQFASAGGIPSTVFTDERKLITAGFGPSRMHWYQNNKGWSENESLYRQLNEGAVSVEEVAARASLLDGLSLQYRARERARDQAQSWLLTRQHAQNLIVDALKAWQQEHRKVYAFLERCGSSRSLRFECGNYNVSNLQHSIALINSAFPAEAQ
ncbi:MAG: hypothetical protein GWM87_06715 [Xanthomonadales bacterium]|nr:hypothetical protein [Xanthomonadales bacterium]NIX12657.1 hypothetical protein [Xanthomonadales bacterium]